MTKPQVVYCKRAAYDVYIGRASGGLPASKWGNPFVIGKDGTRDEVIARYEAWLKTQPDLIAALPELRGKTLGCWCKGTDGQNDVACHGDVLARLVREQMWQEGHETFMAAAKAAPIEAKEALAAVLKQPTLQVIESAPIIAAHMARP